MLYFRSQKSPAGTALSSTNVRRYSLLSLLAYPVGGVIMLLSDNAMLITKVIGLALVMVAFALAFQIVRSSAQRIVAEVDSLLDERELAQRSSALGAAYKIFTALVLGAAICLAIAQDQGWWLPHGYDQFNFIIWGVFLYAVILPVTVLVWTQPVPPETTD